MSDVIFAEMKDDKEKIEVLAAHLANMWSYNLYLFTLVNENIPHKLDTKSAEGNAASMQQVSGILYVFRDALKAALPSRDYELVEQTAMFSIYALAEAKYRETGDFTDAVMTMMREIGKLQRADVQGRANA